MAHLIIDPTGNNACPRCGALYTETHGHWLHCRSCGRDHDLKTGMPATITGERFAISLAVSGTGAHETIALEMFEELSALATSNTTPFVMRSLLGDIRNFLNGSDIAEHIGDALMDRGRELISR